MQNLAQVLKERLSPEHLVELWLIKATNQSLSQHIDELKDTLSFYQEECDELGINYSWVLTEDDTPTQRELEHALDQEHLTKIKEKENPTLKRSNFRYVEKQYNSHSRYTRYILANGGERIITDDELLDNPYLARQIAMSDAREEWDFEEYNRLKQQPISNDKWYNREPSFEQCFIKIGSKFIWDAFNLPLYSLKTKSFEDEEWNITYEEKDKKNERLMKYISYISWVKLNNIKEKIETKIKDKIKIKIVNLNNKVLTTLS